MAIFTNHKLQLAELFKVIPEELFEAISRDTNVDFYSKVLNGKLLFYLLLYALLMDNKLGQRGHCRPVFGASFSCLNLQKIGVMVQNGGIAFYFYAYPI